MLLLKKNRISTIRISFISKRVLRIFLFSFIWLSTPILFFYTPEIKSDITFNKSLLTPYSVSVSGYTRDDGTVVGPYKRRPPGSVLHDEPYEKEIKSLEGKLKIIYLFFITSIFIVIFYSYKELTSFEEKFDYYIHSKILTKLIFDIRDLTVKPPHLINRLISRYSSSKIYKCIYCKKSIGNDEFHYSSLAKSNPQKTCLSCMLKMELKFKDELFYVYKFESKLKNFIENYTKISDKYFHGYSINKRKIEKYFYQKVKESRK